jgi:hypothetical protein
MDLATIAVSKLCCPVCWELMIVLHFDVRGRHPTLFRVPMPLFTPVEVLKPMVERFRRHLRDELMDRYQNDPTDTKNTGKSKDTANTKRPGHKHSASLQSDDGFDHSINTGKIIASVIEQNDSEVIGPVPSESVSDDSDAEDNHEEGLDIGVEPGEEYGDCDDSSEDSDDGNNDYCVRLPGPV